MSAPNYQYQSLHSGRIRISTILAGPDNSKLRLRLQTHDVNSLPDYLALSYCWGEGPIWRECSCEDEASAGFLPLSDNLLQALLHIRREDNDIPIWDDQICIDQQNDEEKAHQVRLMGQVYGEALRVVVWLGCADEESYLAFNLIDNVRKQVKDHVRMEPDITSDIPTRYYPLDLDSADSLAWLAFRHLLKRPWFSRLWVFQEIALSREALFVCGVSFLWLRDLTLVCEAVKEVDRHIPDHQSHIKGVDELLFRMSVCQSMNSTWSIAPEIRRIASDYFELLNLMKGLMGQQVSLPQDFVYALLGLANDVDALDVVVDYSQHFRILFAHITKHFVSKYSDLTVLALISIVPPDSPPTAGPRGLPSWIPDYRSKIGNNNRRLSHGPNIVKHGRDRHYNSTGSSRAFAVADGSLKFIVNGVLVGRIKVLSEPDHNLQDGASIGPNVVSGGQWSKLAARCAPEGQYAPTGEPIDQAFARLRVADYLPEEKNTADRAVRAPTIDIPEPRPSAILRTPNGELLLEAAEDDKMTSCIITATTRQRFFITNTGYMGLCHLSCVIGDEVWLLMGGDMPFILRQLKTEPITYHFKGESYVHGIMDGELLLQRFKGDSAKSDGEWLDDLKDGLPFETKQLILS